MPKPPAARQVAFAPTSGADEAAITEAAMILPEVLDGKSVLVGEEVEAGKVRLLVTGTTPPGRVRVDAAATEFDLSPRAWSADPESRRHIFDLLVMVDRSWSMGKNREDRPAPYSLVRPALDPFVKQAGDLVRLAALVSFSGEPAVESPFAPIAALDSRALARTRPRGRTALAPALEFGLAALASGGDARNRQAILLFTDDAEGDSRVPDVAARAARLGVNVHVVDLGDKPSDGLRAVARATRGVYAYMPDAVTLGPVFRTLATELEAPFEWTEPPRADPDAPEAEFEVVLRQIPDERPRLGRK